MTIGKTLQNRAAELGMSQYQLAKDTGLSQPFIGMLFKDEKSPSLESLNKLCSALGITLAEFFAEDSESDPKEARLIAAYRRLPEEKQDTVLTIVEAL